MCQLIMCRLLIRGGRGRGVILAVCKKVWAFFFLFVKRVSCGGCRVFIEGWRDDGEELFVEFVGRLLYLICV